MYAQEQFKPFTQRETKKLFLREINHSDAKGLVAFLSDDEVMNNTDLTTQSTIHDSEKFIVHLKKGSKR